ncbi:MAG: DNA alkylation repair protein [Candidatus Bathyarchaeota archaeon]|nr:DNA alkylation repair protein [Candidatus Bathyarchaeota archaeon]
MSSLHDEILAEIKRQANPVKAEEHHRYFREPIETYGLSSPQAKEIAKQYYPQVKGNLDKALQLTEELLSHRNVSVSSVALFILQRFEKKLEPKHFKIFDGWVEYLTNWATTDHMTTHMMAATIKKDPSLVEELLRWTGSENRWRRRAAAVSLVPIARKGEMFDDVFRLADILMEDGDDMVQKGVGWLLKEASKRHPSEVREYLLEWRTRTSGLVLRYASEKLPYDMKVLKTRF